MRMTRDRVSARTHIRTLILFPLIYGLCCQLVPRGFWQFVYVICSGLVVVIIADLVEFQSHRY